MFCRIKLAFTPDQKTGTRDLYRIEMQNKLKQTYIFLAVHGAYSDIGV